MAQYLSRTFFAQELERLTAAYGVEIGGKKVAVQLMLRDGQTMKLEGKPTCTDEYVVCDFKGKGAPIRAVLPYGSIIGVSLVADTAPTMGFAR